MAKKLTTYEKLRRAFSELGLELKEPNNDGIVSFAYEHYPYVLVIDEAEQSFYLSDEVTGPEGLVPEHTFNSALEVTKNFHKDIDGLWSKDGSFLVTDIYLLEGRRHVSKTFLKSLLKNFFEAHTFMECNVFLMLDKSIWPDLISEALDEEETPDVDTEVDTDIDVDTDVDTDTDKE